MIQTTEGGLSFYHREFYKAMEWGMAIPGLPVYVSLLVYFPEGGKHEPIRSIQVLGYAIGEGLIPIEWVSLCGMKLKAEEWGTE